MSLRFSTISAWKDVRFLFSFICFTKVNVKFVLFVFISISHDVNLAILRNTMGVTSEAGSSYLFGAPDFNLMFLVSSHCSIATKIVFCVEFCRQFFVLLSCFYWPLHCLSSICMRLLTPPPLVSSFLFIAKHIPTTDTCSSPWFTSSWLSFMFVGGHL